ncbi:hypothetical protein [Ferrovibrio sp.]|uniref:hypothetical protein n=1 Tax=Ferrovibrio sp. TaxID=1917215 RepID=UPI0035122386
MVQDYHQNQIETVAGNDPVSQALRLLQVLNSRATEVQVVTTRMFELATIQSFADYADGFRRVQEFLSFCDVIESKLDNIPPSTREPILHEVSSVKLRAFSALLRAMGAYLTALERRGMINFFAQAIFLMQQDVLEDFRVSTLPEIPRQLVPENLMAVYEQVRGLLRRLLDRCIDVPDFRFES